MSDKTIRLLFPEWQGGDNPNYYFGAHLLEFLAPKSNECKTIEVPVYLPAEGMPPIEYGVVAGKAIEKQQKTAMRILKAENPDRIITFGGDCSVEQAPIDYLHGKYGKELGLIWIDVHPDFSEPDDFKHEHAHVLGNLLGGGCPKLAEIVENPLTTDQVMYAGLKTQDLENYEKKHMEHYKLKYATPDSLKKDSSEVICWILENGFKKIVIHWDLDVLSPIDFRSLLCNEPHMPPVEYAVGDMYLDEIGRLINDISKAADIVGLGITEYMPWDAIRLNRTLSSIDIFKD